MQKFFHAAATVVVGCAMCGVAACSNSSSRPTASVGGVVHVVAAENFWGNIAAQIGGSHVQVTSIISDPNADPHTYETDPKDAAAISAASFVILNGVGYDDFASKLLAASPNASRTVITIAKVAGVTGSNPNPHLWYDPTYVKAAVSAIAAALIKVDPTNATVFKANQRAFLKVYQPYIDELAAIKARYAGTKIAYTERVPGYLVQAAGLVLGTPASFSQAVEDGTDPSPSDTATFDADITAHKVKVLLYNAQVTDEQTNRIKTLAASAHVPVVGMSETLPPGERDFQSWQFDQARRLSSALDG